MNRIQPTSILYSTHKIDLQYPCRFEDAKYEKEKKHRWKEMYSFHFQGPRGFV
jgi:hypothetical protein